MTTSHLIRFGDHPKGFTLIELLIAMVVFATLSLMAYGGLNTIMAADEQVRLHSTRLKQLQRSWMMIGEDLTQLVGRSARDSFGDSQPPLLASEMGDIRLELTRGGWSNPAGVKRSELQRVGYGVVDKELIRYSWRVLDRAQDSEPQKHRLLDGVAGIRLRFLDQKQQWHSSWPPLGTDAESLPIGVEMVMELEQEGEIRRLFRIVDQIW